MRDKSILATGYNGSVRSTAHCDDVGHLLDRDGKCVRTVHAETNAIYQAARNGVRIDGATMYVTASPCFRCYQAIANSGIVRVIGHLHRDRDWFQEAERIGIEVVDVPLVPLVVEVST